MKKKTIKICDGFKVTWHGGFEEFDGITSVWDMFGWDIKNDETARELARDVVREVFCTGIAYLKDCDGYTVTVEAIPVGEKA